MFRTRCNGLTEVDAREFVLLCDFLRAEVLLDRDRVVRSALDRSLCVPGQNKHMSSFLRKTKERTREDSA
jgi:hypothetical protein